MRSFRFLGRAGLSLVGILTGFAAVVLAGIGLTGGEVSLFVTYYEMFPMMTIVVLFAGGFAMASTHLRMALSMGGRRIDFFWSLQVLLLLLTLWGCLVTAALYQLPALLGWPDFGSNLLSVGNLWGWLNLAVSCFVVLVLSALIGQLITRHPAVGLILLFFGLFFIMCAAFTSLFLVKDATDNWGNWLAILNIIQVGFTALGEVLLYRSIMRTVVR